MKELSVQGEVIKDPSQVGEDNSDQEGVKGSNSVSVHLDIDESYLAGQRRGNRQAAAYTGFMDTEEQR